ncbi:MAG: T9SS C-terminal target domain-containing protein [Haliscomenobacteraceae bacterium CHB4]|nr:T9SS C-terminal target domain-containing protein [Haliscomenobacteraceae bacterium CHB4]
MKQIILPFSVLFLLLANLSTLSAQNPGCDGSRYKDDVFTSVKKTTVNYGANTNQLNQQINLAIDIYEPEGDNLSARPVVILAHGGSFIFGDKGDMKKWCELLAKKGYIAASVQYRLYPFFVLGFPDSIKIFDQAVRAISDMKAAVRFFRDDADNSNLFRADADNIFIGGYSAGAVAALHAGFLDSADVVPSFIQNAIDANGGLNGNTGTASNQAYPSFIKAVVNMSGGLYRSDWVDIHDVPVVSIHGTADETVPFVSGLAAGLAFLEGSSLVHQKAESVGLLHNLHPVPGGGHTNIYESSQPAYVPHIDTFWVNVTTMLEFLVCQTSAVDEAEHEAENWSAYPNPVVSGVFQIQFPGDIRQASLVMTDLSGKIVFQQHNIQDQGIVRVSGLPAGVYTVRLMDWENERRQFAVKKLVLGR